MKTVIAVFALIFSITASAAPAVTVNSSSKKDSKITAARVVQLVTLLDKQGGNGANLMVNVLVEDTGGSTDVSPTQKVYLTMYSKGEMFSTDATFEIADVLSFKSAKRVEAGVYEITVTGFDDDYHMKDITYVVNGKQASIDIQAVQCDDFDCDASTFFKSSVSVTTK